MRMVHKRGGMAQSSGQTEQKIQLPTVRMIRTVHIDGQICLSIKNLASFVLPSLSVPTI
jgi:hypothetical protein